MQSSGLGDPSAERLGRVRSRETKMASISWLLSVGVGRRSQSENFCC